MKQYWQTGGLLILTPLLLISQTIQGKIGQEVSTPTHLQDSEEFYSSTSQLIEFGKKLFTAMWTSQEDAGLCNCRNARKRRNFGRADQVQALGSFVAGHSRQLCTIRYNALCNVMAGFKGACWETPLPGKALRWSKTGVVYRDAPPGLVGVQCLQPRHARKYRIGHSRRSSTKFRIFCRLVASTLYYPVHFVFLTGETLKPVGLNYTFGMRVLLRKMGEE